MHIFDLSGKKTDWESWLKMFISCGKCKDYKKLLINFGSLSEVVKIPTQGEYENDLEGDMDLVKNC